MEYHLQQRWIRHRLIIYIYFTAFYLIHLTHRLSSGLQGTGWKFVCYFIMATHLSDIIVIGITDIHSQFISVISLLHSFLHGFRKVECF